MAPTGATARCVLDYARITCPTMLVGGWADGYRNNSLRTFAALRCPKALLMGPWSHMSTATSLPGPHIDLVPEMIQWFGRWLRDEDNGVDREPPIRVFVRHATRPEPDLAEHDGRVAGRAGMAPGAVVNAGSDGGRQRRTMSSRCGPTSAPARGSPAPGSCRGANRRTSAEDDAWSLVYDWPAAEGPVEILGHPQVHLTLRSTAPVAWISAKLNDVFPDGTSALVTRGMLNLTHRTSSTAPEAMPVGEAVDVAVELEAAAYVFPPGHRIRLSLAGTDWPNTWPPPTPVSLSVERCLDQARACPSSRVRIRSPNRHDSTRRNPTTRTRTGIGTTHDRSGG